jgi:hypothetical protein
MLPGVSVSVLDLSNLIAGPVIATNLADFGPVQRNSDIGGTPQNDSQ